MSVGIIYRGGFFIISGVRWESVGLLQVKRTIKTFVHVVCSKSSQYRQVICQLKDNFPTFSSIVIETEPMLYKANQTV